MSDVIKVAQQKRQRLLAEIEDALALVDELEGFIRYARKLNSEDAGVEMDEDDNRVPFPHRMLAERAEDARITAAE